MNRKSNATLIFVLSLALGGCYHATVVTGATPGPQTLERRWATSLIGGLVPPPEVDAASRCGSGVARVETRLSFLNMLVGAITFGIYTPMDIRVTCAAGQDDVDAEDPQPSKLPVVETREEAEAALREGRDFTFRF